MSRVFDAWMRRLESLSAGWLFAVTGVWLLWLSWLRPMTLPDEGRYAGVAWEMLRAGEHVVPLLNGMPFFHKPPLYYWLASTAFDVFGVHPWVARLPSWLAAWAAAMAVYGFIRHYRGVRAATVSLLVLATQPFFFGAAQFANLDMLVAGMITLTTVAGAATVLNATRGAPWRTLAVATAVLAALGVLSKGLIGVVLPGGILLIWIAMLRQWRGLAALLWPPAIGAFVVVCLPWFWAMQKEFPGFFNYFFIYQQFDRFAETGFNNRQPVWFYLPVLAGFILPWTFWLGAVFRKAFWAERGGDAYAVRLLMGVWIVVVLAFFSLPASKLVGYVLPTLAPLAVLVAEVIVTGLSGDNAQSSRRLYRGCLSTAIVLCVLMTAFVAIYARPNSAPLGARARAEVKPGDQIVMLHAYGYDLPMALRDPRPAWVVDDWNNPDIPKRDNWRKELYDAGQFRPEAMKDTLISVHELQARLCAAPAGQTFWFWGNPEDDQDAYPALRGKAPFAVSGKRALWRVVPDAAFKSQYCGGTPKTD
ncbi:ArnT family glycosyltransferase [Bordetella genomosp. 11]|uniref:Dolichyl-phosphate-mannose--protein mannosyltransferase n=1 Tax=Bordetella genomosp. 11 TaxID=1416808 RepID=A0A261UKF9_9BORD|nr:glycosyltransferase family 39 protein [Bordetella genomosp. 11]OZI62366.1 dolichyl-phosphate-mannose--protein mannosyltransferase [Bordetella genomosp. 11]